MYRFVCLIVIIVVSVDAFQHDEYDTCLDMSARLKWNRTFSFNNNALTLNLEVSDDPAHWIVNFLFEILARERLGYRNIRFVKKNLGTIEEVVNRLRCSNSECTRLPEVHLNLLLWLPLGVDIKFWMAPEWVSDHGPLGPVSQWRLFQMNKGSHSNLAVSGLSYHQSCLTKAYPNSGLHKLYKPTLSNTFNGSHASKYLNKNVTLLGWELHGNKLTYRISKFNDPPFCDEDGRYQSNSHSSFCRTRSYQAVKLSWAHLQTAAPLIYRLASKINLSHEEFNELVESVEAHLTRDELSQSSNTIYRKVACLWLRRNPTKWMSWTTGWDKKLNLTIAGMFSLHGKWVLSGLERIAQDSVRFVNTHIDFFRDSEYALSLDIRNLTCKPDVVLNEYFKILAESNSKRLIGSIAALCSDSIEAVVELANFRNQIIVSPTVSTARFLEHQAYKYFFRTVPSMTEANFILLELFIKFRWTRFALFRRVDNYFTLLLFQNQGINIIADNQEDESELNFKTVYHSLGQLKQSNSRIFVVEHDVRGTYLILCAAYHHGMYFAAGYVWFLNPWLSDQWWEHMVGPDSECSSAQMANITSWTFTVGHQVVISSYLHSFHPVERPVFDYMESKQPYFSAETNGQQDQMHRLRRDAAPLSKLRSTSDIHETTNSMPVPKGKHSRTDLPKSHVSKDPMQDYAVYTNDAVILLASAITNLLRVKPSSISALDNPSVAETYRELVANTSFGYRLPKTSKNLDDDESFDFGFQSPGEYYGFTNQERAKKSQLRFNRLNERIADYWLVKQRTLNTTVPILMWEANNYTDSSSIYLSNLSAANFEHLLRLYEEFRKRMDVHELDPVYWMVPGQPPYDGSVSIEDCLFPFLSNTLGMGCTGATVFVAVTVTVVFLLPVIILAYIYYHRKLKEAEKRTRKPFEELCAELQDLDMPASTIVLNRQVGQGAFGHVYGGEAKKDGLWHAVAVKVINDKATYEGKIDFLSEAKLMRSLDHRNVVRLIGISLNPKANLYLIMELMLLGDLKTYLLSRRIVAQRSPNHEDVHPSTLTQMSIDIAQGVAYLHSKSLIHRDIACRNCLVGADRTVKIGDFGLTRKTAENNPQGYYRFTRSGELPIRWMSPEAVQFGVFSVHSDIWSFGITLYEIITFGVFPYNGLGDVEVVERVKRMEISITEFLPPKATNTTVWRLINNCCQHQWQHRPISMNQVIEKLVSSPECIQPFLTDDPPQPNTSMDSLLFQPTLGTCIVSKTALSGFAVMDSATTTAYRSIRSVSAALVPDSEAFSVNYGPYSVGGEFLRFETPDHQPSIINSSSFMLRQRDNQDWISDAFKKAVIRRNHSGIGSSSKGSHFSTTAVGDNSFANEQTSYRLPNDYSSFCGSSEHDQIPLTDTKLQNESAHREHSSRNKMAHLRTMKSVEVGMKLTNDLRTRSLSAENTIPCRTDLPAQWPYQPPMHQQLSQDNSKSADQHHRHRVKGIEPFNSSTSRCRNWQCDSYSALNRPLTESLHRSTKNICQSCPSLAKANDVVFYVCQS